MNMQSRRRSSIPEAPLKRTLALPRRSSMHDAASHPAALRQQRTRQLPNTPLQACGATRKLLPEETTPVQRGVRYQVLPGIGGGKGMEPASRVPSKGLWHEAGAVISAVAPEFKLGQSLGRCYPREFTSPLPFDVSGLLSQHGAMAKYSPGMSFGVGSTRPSLKPKENQDRAMVIYPFAGSASQALFMVADGHGEQGAMAAEQACALMGQLLAADRRISEALHNSADDVCQGFTDCFEEVNRRLHSMSQLQTASGGATMSVALVSGHMMWTAWAGDSRMILGKSLKRMEELSRDHTCCIPAETLRMKKAGGIVMTNEHTGVTRVCVSAGPDSNDVYTLNMSRSLGDKFFHDYGGVVATPEVRSRELMEDDKVLVLASDGVWEHIESKAASDALMARHASGNDASQMCQALIDLAMRRWKEQNPAYRDDISAVVVDVQKLLAILKAQPTASPQECRPPKQQRHGSSDLKGSGDWTNGAGAIPLGGVNSNSTAQRRVTAYKPHPHR